MAQDINHRHELETLTDDELGLLVINYQHWHLGQPNNAESYIYERRHIAKLILKEREEKRMYIACLEQ